ncbi:GNAT family N-acetyltransferase [Clostridium sediminicola]|uniref:GNAT family N-acetyltransferase n=1 Tax=Clostridium sediminicola TaxID=3114879 RepID=UPI0031F1E896
MLRLKTKRLKLRPLETEDIDSVMNFWGNEEVMKYSGGAGNKESEERSIAFYINLQKEKGFSPFIVSLKENNQIIGACGFNPTDKDSEIELIYHFSKEYWGQGYATEAAEELIAYAIENLKKEKIIASTSPQNNPSMKVLKKLGFSYVGMKWFEDTKQEEPCFELFIHR